MLTSRQRQQLKKRAHHLQPVVMVGKHGLTDAVVDSTANALDAHELIKVRFVDHKGEKAPISQELAARTESEIVDTIGHVLLLYRQHPDPEKRRIDIEG